MRQRSSGRWQARVRAPLSGAVVALGTFVTKADADRAVSLALADQTRGAWVDPGRGRRLVADYAWTWLSERPQVRPRTRELSARPSATGTPLRPTSDGGTRTQRTLPAFLGTGE